MKKYYVWFTKCIDACVTVEAESEELATEAAKERFWSMTPEQRLEADDVDIQSGKYEYSYTDEEEEDDQPCSVR